eukprot:252712-Amorphochlora_amoeboformis.AAC.1
MLSKSGYRRSLSRASTALAKAKAVRSEHLTTFGEKYILPINLVTYDRALRRLKERSEEVLQERLARSKAQIEADQMAQK